MKAPRKEAIREVLFILIVVILLLLLEISFRIVLPSIYIIMAVLVFLLFYLFKSDKA